MQERCPLEHARVHVFRSGAPRLLAPAFADIVRRGSEDGTTPAGLGLGARRVVARAQRPRFKLADSTRSSRPYSRHPHSPES